jgi:hypothetical protein
VENSAAQWPMPRELLGRARKMVTVQKYFPLRGKARYEFRIVVRKTKFLQY